VAQLAFESRPSEVGIAVASMPAALLGVLCASRRGATPDVVETQATEEFDVLWRWIAISSSMALVTQANTRPRTCELAVLGSAKRAEPDKVQLQIIVLGHLTPSVVVWSRRIVA
jgi:hypothetical protein